MLIFPAIDVLDGQAVRLFQGDYARKQVFGSDPAAFARSFAAQGARHLHLVDLDGARCGSMRSLSVAGKIAAIEGLFVEMGGGIRDEAAIEACFSAGINRVILGTAALKNPEFTRSMVRKYGRRIAVGVDARGGRVAVEGWLATSEVDSLDFCMQMRDIGVGYIVYTDIARDGTGAGANLAVYEKLAALDGCNITASGGVSTLLDIRVLAGMGLYAAILGKALYTGALALPSAIRAAKEGETA